MFKTTRRKKCQERRRIHFAPSDEPATQQGGKVIHCAKRTGSPIRATGATRESKDIPPITVTRERSCKMKAVGYYTPCTPHKKKYPAPVSLKKS
jgi:hypothetical protein